MFLRIFGCTARAPIKIQIKVLASRFRLMAVMNRGAEFRTAPLESRKKPERVFGQLSLHRQTLEVGSSV